MPELTAAEQQAVYEKHKVSAAAVCNRCNKPITGLVYIDPKGGYFPRQPSMMTGLRAKVTYDRECNALRLGHKAPPPVPTRASVSTGTVKGGTKTPTPTPKRATDPVSGSPGGGSTDPTGTTLDAMFVGDSTIALVWACVRDGKPHSKSRIRAAIGREAINSSLTKLASILEQRGGKLEATTTKNGDAVKVVFPPEKKKKK